MSVVWKIEEKTYQAKALLEVMQDGLCNDVVGINQDYYATSLRVVMDKIDEIQDAINEDYAMRREAMQSEEEYEEDETDADKDEDTLLGTGSIFRDENTATSERGGNFQGREGCEDPGEKRASEDDRFITGSFGVAMMEEHPDGSATFEVHGSKEQMQKLFSAFFADALTRGIDGAEQSTARWTTEKQIVKKAIELEKALKTWESVDEFDYDPEVRKIRTDLTDLIIAYGAER